MAEDQVGKAIEDAFYGAGGVRTGSIINDIAYGEYEKRQFRSPSYAGSSADRDSLASDGRSITRPTDNVHTNPGRFSKVLLGAVVILIAAGAVAGFVYAHFFTVSKYPAWAFALGGAIIGGVVLPAIGAVLVVIINLVEAIIEMVRELLTIVFRLIVVTVIGFLAYQLYQILT